MAGYIGTQPVPQATQTRNTFTATASQTSFATSGYTPGFLGVFLNGVHLQNGIDYTASNGSDVVLTAGAAVGDVLEVVAYTTFEVLDPTFGGTVTADSLSVDGGTIKLDGTYPVGTGNVALGNAALRNATTTASNNTAVGYQAGYSATTEGSSVYVGRQAGYSANGVFNTFVGNESGLGVTSGVVNTFLGHDSGSSITTGSMNVIIGNYDGNEGGLDIRTSSNNIVLSDGDGNARGYFNSSGHFLVNTFNNGQPNEDAMAFTGDMLRLSHVNGNTGKYVYFIYNGLGVGSIANNGGSALSYNTSSDHRLKTDVQAMTGATDRLKQLNAVNFEWLSDSTRADGFIAHEVHSIVPEAITGTHDEVDEDGNPVYQGIDHSKLVPLLVATIQELEARITALEAN